MNCYCDGKYNPFCEKFSKETRNKLCALARPSSIYKRSSDFTKIQYDDQFFYLSSFPPRIQLVQQGFGIVYKNVDQDQLKSIFYYESGSILGDLYLFENLESYDMREYFLQNIKPVRYCIFNAADIEALFRSNAEFAERLQVWTAKKAMIYTDHLVKMCTFTSEQKLSYFRDLAARNGLTLNDFTHEEIAQILNLNRVTVTRSIKNILAYEQRHES